ncbi:hypothetical protein BKA70DRAFT_1424598 [Coprinopsis sp. MPI-PUGE-AT-0042]|nr:hypothetical protein BKA70DRAFT_1424598 [Coprinopsis sp. MPI-PUGE-AT-0042]
MTPAKPTESSLVPRQELDCLHVAAPFYRDACKAGEMNYFLNDFFIHYFKRFPVPRDMFPTVKEREDEIWKRERKIVRQLNWLRTLGLKVKLPTTWQKFVVLDPSPKYGEIARDILAQLDSSKYTGPILRRVVISGDEEDPIIIDDDDDEEIVEPTYTGLDGDEGM